MAHFNQCSQLATDESYKKAEDDYLLTLGHGGNPLDVMISMQKSLQSKLAEDKPKMNQHPDDLDTAGKIVDWMRIQKDCIDDEFRELLTSLGGMSSGEKDASGVWKAWKSNNLEKRNTKISDLSDEDQLEIKFEFIDIVHFVLNMALALGLDAKEIYKLYYLKNAENFKRQENNY